MTHQGIQIKSAKKLLINSILGLVQGLRHMAIQETKAQHSRPHFFTNKI